MNELVSKNWLTTAGGILAGLPSLLAGAGIVLPPQYQKYVTLAGGLGVLLLGAAAKQYNNHSTATQVEQATKTEAK